MRRIAYIPARGGSKGIPYKNIVDLCGAPLISYTIEAALKSGLFDEVMVSTDDQKIADVAVEYGAWVPFLRSGHVASDTSKTIDAVMSDKAILENNSGTRFDEFVLLQCTSPFRTSNDIIGAVNLYERTLKGVVSVSPVRDHPLLMRTLDDDCRVSKLLNLTSTCRRQDMAPYYRVNGAIYVNAWDELVPDLSFNDNPYAYIMEASHSIDIDTVDDLEYARIMMRNFPNNG